MSFFINPNRDAMNSKNRWIASKYNEKSEEVDLDKISSVGSCFGCSNECSTK